MLALPMSDQNSPRHPVSVKAVIKTEKGYVVLKNERNEWELPGGKLEFDESPIQTIKREISEEIGLVAEIGPLIDAWMYHVNGVKVLIITYGVAGVADHTELNFSHEHKDIAFMNLSQLMTENIPEGYIQSILRWEQMSRKLFIKIFCWWRSALYYIFCPTLSRNFTFRKCRYI